MLHLLSLKKLHNQHGQRRRKKHHSVVFVERIHLDTSALNAVFHSTFRSPLHFISSHPRLVTSDLSYSLSTSPSPLPSRLDITSITLHTSHFTRTSLALLTSRSTHNKPPKQIPSSNILSPAAAPSPAQQPTNKPTPPTHLPHPHRNPPRTKKCPLLHQTTPRCPPARERSRTRPKPHRLPPRGLSQAWSPRPSSTRCSRAIHA